MNFCKLGYLLFVIPCSMSNVFAQENNNNEVKASLKDSLNRFVAPTSSQDFKTVSLQELSNFQYDDRAVREFPRIQRFADQPLEQNIAQIPQRLTLQQAVHIALQRHPEISQAVSALAGQNAAIDVARAAYYPQLSGGLSTADLTSGERGRQLMNLNATQLLYDFGKVKTNVSTEEARLLSEQADVLVQIDDIAEQVAVSIVNIKRYQALVYVAQRQKVGIARIAEIAQLRAQAGISSQADPVQAQSYVEAAESNLIVQQTQLSIYQQKLRTLLGFAVDDIQWDIPEHLMSDLEQTSSFNINDLPRMMVAHADVEIAKLRTKQTQLSRYPTVNMKGSLSQAVNGRNPNNSQDNGFYSSIMLEANSHFYQGGATGAQIRAASFAEEAAKAKVNQIYLETMDRVRLIQAEVQNKKRQMNILTARAATTARTKELYQEQYKLGTRTVVDLLNAEQAIHSAAQEIENVRYDIYSSVVQYIAATGKTRQLYQLNNTLIQGVEVKP